MTFNVISGSLTEMNRTEKESLLTQIAAADICQLRHILMRLGDMNPTPDVLELIDIADENVDALGSKFGDF